MRRRLALIVGILGGAWALLRSVRPFRVEVAGESMRPTLSPGDWLVAVRARRIRRGDLVVVRRPERGIEVVKRVALLPGEGGLGAGQYFVLGDHPGRSTDGRSFGPVTADRIAGVVVARYWPRPALF